MWADEGSPTAQSNPLHVGLRCTQPNLPLRLSAGQDLNLKAASLTSDAGNLLATAGRDVSLGAGEAYLYVDDAHKTTNRGVLSRTTTITRDTIEQITAPGSTLSGDTATVSAGRDLTVTGGSIVSDRGTELAAGRDIEELNATRAIFSGTDLRVFYELIS